MWNELQFLSMISSVNLLSVNVTERAADLASVVFPIAQMQILPSQQIYERTLEFKEGDLWLSKQFRLMGFQGRSLIQAMGSHFILYNFWFFSLMGIAIVEFVRWRMFRSVKPEVNDGHAD
jgi:hypothetical protein